MIASVTFVASRHPTDRWYSCRTNQVSEKSIAIRFAGSCPITWRAISRLSSDFGIGEHLRTCDHCRAVYEGLRNIVRLLGDEEVIELPEGFSQRLYNRLLPVF